MVFALTKCSRKSTYFDSGSRDSSVGLFTLIPKRHTDDLIEFMQSKSRLFYRAWCPENLQTKDFRHKDSQRVVDALSPGIV
jgi:hypothetical protein